ncbi:MAG: phosphatase PAP2 family protein [Simkaniaceae bacterium]|nr:phosphatase PAP2 family protein [Simkaniaceae bacterium]
MFYLERQLDFLHFLEKGRGPWIDPFFRALHFFDSTLYALLLITFIWIGYSAKWGIRLGFLLISNGLINHMAKALFILPRPGAFDSNLPMVRVDGFGFPSGGAQMTILLGALLIYFWKHPLATPIAILYTLLISFSRMFLGVHFPIDVLGGWIIGLCLFFAFIKLVNPIEHFASKKPEITLVTTLALSSGLILFFPSFKVTFLLLSAFFTAIGVYFSSRFHLYLTHQKSALLGLFAIFSCFLVGFAMYCIPLPPPFSKMAQMSAMSLWVSLGVSPFCKKIFKLGTR